MADNVAITAGSGTTIAADDIAGVLVQRVKTTWGPDGTMNDADTASGKALPIQVRNSTGTEMGTTAAPFKTQLSDGTDLALIDSNGSLQVLLKDSTGASVTYDIGVKPMNFAVAATTLTRPANQTQYSVNDSVSNNGTAGSVTALSATVSDTNDAPINLTHITLDTNDTAIGAATTTMRVYVYNSDPTASTGVAAGDNAAFSNKRAGLVGTFVGTFTAMSDGGKCVCVPESGAPYVACKPTSGAKTLFVQHQIIGGTPTPSANSTTIDTTLCGFQGRAT